MARKWIYKQACPDCSAFIQIDVTKYIRRNIAEALEKVRIHHEGGNEFYSQGYNTAFENIESQIAKVRKSYGIK